MNRPRTLAMALFALAFALCPDARAQQCLGIDGNDIDLDGDYEYLSHPTGCNVSACRWWGQNTLTFRTQNNRFTSVQQALISQSADHWDMGDASDRFDGVDLDVSRDPTGAGGVSVTDTQIEMNTKPHAWFEDLGVVYTGPGVSAPACPSFPCNTVALVPRVFNASSHPTAPCEMVAGDIIVLRDPDEANAVWDTDNLPSEISETALLNPAGPQNVFSYEALITHEVGHLIGLAHGTQPSLVVGGTYGDLGNGLLTPFARDFRDLVNAFNQSTPGDLHFREPTPPKGSSFEQNLLASRFNLINPGDVFVEQFGGPDFESVTADDVSRGAFMPLRPDTEVFVFQVGRSLPLTPGGSIARPDLIFALQYPGDTSCDSAIGQDMVSGALVPVAQRTRVLLEIPDIVFSNSHTGKRIVLGNSSLQVPTSAPLGSAQICARVEYYGHSVAETTLDDNEWTSEEIVNVVP